MSAYHSLRCPHCLKQVTVRLEPEEHYTGRCQCPHRTVSVVWTNHEPELIKAIAEIVTQETIETINR